MGAWEETYLPQIALALPNCGNQIRNMLKFRLAIDGKPAKEQKDRVIKRFFNEGLLVLNCRSKAWTADSSRWDADASVLPASAVPSRKERAAVITTKELRRDVLWVYNHLEVAVGKDDAPSLGAWGMRKWAKSNQKEFFSKYLHKFIPPVGAAGSGTKRKGKEDDGSDVADILDTSHRLVEDANG